METKSTSLLGMVGLILPLNNFQMWILLLDRLKIEGSNVINMDIPATNGVIQVVENIIEIGSFGFKRWWMKTTEVV